MTGRRLLGSSRTGEFNGAGRTDIPWRKHGRLGRDLGYERKQHDRRRGHRDSALGSMAWGRGATSSADDLRAREPGMTIDAAKTEGAGSNTQVLIIGAGPAGLFAACELLRHGVKPRIIERRLCAPSSKSFIFSAVTR